MPRGNGTGPAGMGPMTGRAAGFCAGYGMPGYANAAGGRGYFGRGRGGGGGGRRNWYYATGLPRWARAGYGAPANEADARPFVQQVSTTQDLEDLKGQAKYLADTLEEITSRIEELENRTNSKK